MAAAPAPTSLVAPPRFTAADFPLPSWHRFRPAGEVTTAKLSTSPLRSIRQPGSYSPTQKAGKRYEAKIFKRLAKLAGSGADLRVIESPWISFSTLRDTDRRVQPDLLIFQNRQLLLCEIKLAHTVDAYWQLVHLYAPVVRRVFPDYELRLVEITKSFDPAIRFGDDMRLFFDFGELLAGDVFPGIDVLQWKSP